MDEETTQNMPDARSFEERIFARFDTLDARFDNLEVRFDDLDARLHTLEDQTERRALETKPIWERALAEILEVKERLNALEQLSHQVIRKIDVLGKDMLTLRADQAGIEDRLDKLESTHAQ
jgi:chromosome segregation ATPase